MNFILRPWQFFFAILAGWVNREQQEAIDYLRTEIAVLKEQLHRPGRILLNDDQRRRLTVEGKVLGRMRLEEVGTLFTPDTILRWHLTGRHPRKPDCQRPWPRAEYFDHTRTERRFSNGAKSGAS